MRARVSRAVALADVLATSTVAGCGAEQAPFVLPEYEAEQYATAYLARVEPAPEGDDLTDGGGEYVVIANNADIRVDMGGWYIDDAAGTRLNLGIGRQIDVGKELRVYSSCGESTDEAVFACAGSRCWTTRATCSRSGTPRDPKWPSCVTTTTPSETREPCLISGPGCSGQQAG